MPVLLFLECTDLIFTIHHHAHGNRLHPAGRQTVFHGMPKHGRELVAHNAVQHTPCLLGVDQILIDLSWILDAFCHHIFGDLVEGYPLCLLIRKSQQLLEMPGDGLSLAVRVRREENGVGLFSLRFQLFDYLCLIPHGDIFGFKGLQVHTE